MLDPWIIEEIRRREDEKRRDLEHQVELPLVERPHVSEEETSPAQTNDEQKRGVIVIDI